MSALGDGSTQTWTPDPSVAWPCPWKAGSVIGAGRCREWQAECCGCASGERAAAVVALATGAGKAASRHKRTETVACVECSRPFQREAGHGGRQRRTCSPACWLVRRQRANAARYARLPAVEP